MSKALRVWKKVFSLLRRSPRVLVPFVVSACFNVIALYVLYLAPQRPVSSLLAPPIRAFFGEKFLHFPSNLYLLPKLFSYGSLVVSATVGVVMTAVAVGMVKNIFSDRRPVFWANFLYALKRYFALVGAWFIVFIISYFCGKLFKNHIPGFLKNPVAAGTVYALLMLFVQAVFVYLIPAIVGKNSGLWAAIKKNFSFLARMPVVTLILVLVPVVLYIPYIFLERSSGVLMNWFSPDVVVAVLIVGIFVTFLMDVLITLSTTVVFLRGEK